MYKLSVVIPVYNTEQYLPRCIESLINQTYKNIEFIFVNDCSPKNAEEIIKEYQFPKLFFPKERFKNLPSGYLIFSGNS